MRPMVRLATAVKTQRSSMAYMLSSRERNDEKRICGPGSDGREGSSKPLREGKWKRKGKTLFSFD